MYCYILNLNLETQWTLVYKVNFEWKMVNSRWGFNSWVVLVTSEEIASQTMMEVFSVTDRKVKKYLNILKNTLPACESFSTAPGLKPKRWPVQKRVPFHGNTWLVDFCIKQAHTKLIPVQIVLLISFQTKCICTYNKKGTYYFIYYDFNSVCSTEAKLQNIESLSKYFLYYLYESTKKTWE